MENFGFGDGPQNMMNQSLSVTTDPVVETAFESYY